LLTKRNHLWSFMSSVPCTCGSECSAKIVSRLWQILHAAVILSGLVCILHYFFFGHQKVGLEMAEDGHEWPSWAGGALLALAVLPVMVSFFLSSPRQLRREAQLEAQYREYGNVMLLSGALSGFLVSLVILRRWLKMDAGVCSGCGRFPLV